MLIGYARVSTQDQNLDLQKDALKAADCSKIFTDKISGAKTERDGLAQALEFLREGDSLVVWKLDRLGRSLRDLINIVQDLERREISFVCTSQNIDTRTPSGKLFFHIFGALAEYEREIIRERTKAGLSAARARGRLGGRKRALTPAQVTQIKAMMANKNIPIKSILETFGIAKPTLYKYLKEADDSKETSVKTDLSTNGTSVKTSTMPLPFSKLKAERVHSAQIKLKLWIENKSKFTRGKGPVRLQIERYCLSPFQMKKLKNGAYQLTFHYADVNDLQRQMDDLEQEMHSEADFKNCLIEAGFYDKPEELDI